MKVVWSNRAKSHLRLIVDYIWDHNPSAAIRVNEVIVEAAQQLVEFPKMGRPGRVAGTREWVIAGLPYIVAYRQRDNRIEIAAALHAARKWPRNFGGQQAQ